MRSQYKNLSIYWSCRKGVPKGIKGWRIPFTSLRLPPRDRAIITCIVSFDGHLYSADACCNPIDKYNENTGRKISLTKCLKKVAPKSKKFRSYVWFTLRRIYPKLSDVDMEHGRDFWFEIPLKYCKKLK